jgi:hypothetical protein
MLHKHKFTHSHWHLGDLSACFKNAGRNLRAEALGWENQGSIPCAQAAPPSEIRHAHGHSAPSPLTGAVPE